MVSLCYASKIMDLERSTPEATQAILESMEWLNLRWEHVLSPNKTL